MKTKYFRFMFCESKACFLHFGELTDTLMNEQFDFLYLKGSQKETDERLPDDSLFLCPKHLHVLVLGNANERTDAGYGKLLKDTAVDVVVYPESDYEWKTKLPEGTRQVVLGTGSETIPKTGSEVISEKGSETIPKTGSEAISETGSEAVPENEMENAGSFTFTRAGWQVFAKCYAEGNITMAHGLAGKEGSRLFEATAPETRTGIFGNGSGESDTKVFKITSEPEEEKDFEGMTEPMAAECMESVPEKETVKSAGSPDNSFEDCVMNVKVLDRNQRCSCDKTPDVYGCAMGCGRKKDMDVCRYRRESEAPYLLGTLLWGDGVREADVKEMEKDLGDCHGKVRFLRFPANAEPEMVSGWMQGAENVCKRYYPGLTEEMSDGMVAEICRGGLYQMPVVLCEEEGLCCAGFLKYVED